jgi:hypothetical protein
MFSWLSVLDKILAFVIALVRGKQERDAVQEGVQRANEAQQDDLEKRNVEAEKARDSVERAPVERLRDDDGFRRD